MAIGSLLTTDEVAEMLGVNASRISHFVREGRIKPARRIGRSLLFERKDVQRLAKVPRETGRPKKLLKTRRSGIAKSK